MTLSEDQRSLPVSSPKLCMLQIKAEEQLQPSGNEQGRSCFATIKMPLWLTGSGI